MKTSIAAFLVGALFAPMALAGLTTSICNSIGGKNLGDDSICRKAGAKALGKGLCCFDRSNALIVEKYNANCDDLSGTVQALNNPCS
ncbi:hypothetical protein MCOR27_000432 [Pyricularia oryzae]|uniref:Uncharacterized protein n=1 Tax=Pyricularia oryzae TaxID=318829 RepID=A0A4P7NKS0_PYROR|nr:hypothetical protein MCOR01_007535 [Pyricularia oryzae]KAI6258386.1 hypothetical protein MCOR19_005261 [Pyricularia oryzae]KAI6289110.1 hypothetical protein MCOR27_000432 [Pyricularia oryzae]KAI6334393.1 hypothetical protein MCOR29_000703 [Pyricularia oryzae]KAI6347647.1 hypothetical protein MCOR30_000279 [Pyricularia oryzae]